jgi:hypothetical protein
VVKASLLPGYDVASQGGRCPAFETRNFFKYTISGKEMCVSKFCILNAQCVSDSIKREGVLQGLKKSDNINKAYGEE